MRKYMVWSIMVVVAIMAFAVPFMLVGFNDVLYWNIVDYSSELKNTIDNILIIIGIAGGFMLMGTIGVLPIFGTVDTIILLKQRRIKKREARKVKWLM